MRAPNILKKALSLSFIFTLLLQFLPRPAMAQQISDNGIVVGQTKLFDERTLAMMLRAAEESLARLQFIDQAAPGAAIGRIQGGRSNQSSFGFSVTTLPIPGVTSKVGEEATTSDTLTTSGTTTASGTISGTGNTASTGSTTGTGTTSGETSKLTGEEITTRAEVRPLIPEQPAQSSVFPFQGTFGIAAQDILAEQVALNYQVMNLRLLLDRALSDRIITPYDPARSTSSYLQLQRGARAQAVVGFQISVDPRNDYKNAVAEVEVTVTTNPAGTFDEKSGRINLTATPQRNRMYSIPERARSQPTEAPSLVALLPLSKTYNVATVTKNATSLSLGAVVKVFNIGVAAGKKSETFYLVKDTDTVAFERLSAHNSSAVNSGALTFGWQFRPVLGRKAVEPGPRQVFAAMALPNTIGQSFIGAVKVHTHWRKFDAKSGTVSNEPISGSCNEQTLLDLSVLTPEAMEYALEPKVTSVRWEDAGRGQVLVEVQGQNFLPGTGIIVGDTLINKESIMFQGESRMLFYVPAQKLALTRQALIIGRFGRKILEHPAASMATAVSSGLGISIANIYTLPEDAERTRVFVDLQNLARTGPPIITSPLIFNVGGKLYGLGDVPVVEEPAPSAYTRRYSFVAPTQSLRDARKLSVMELFKGRDYVAEMAFNPADISMAASMVYLGTEGTDKKRFAITGSTFVNGATSVRVGREIFGAGGTNSLEIETPSLLVITPTNDQLRGVRQVIVTQGNGQAFTLALPKIPPAAPTVKVPLLKAVQAVSVGDVFGIRIEGESFDSIEEIQFESAKLGFTPAEDGKSMILYLTSAVTQTPGRKQLHLILKDGTALTKEEWRVPVNAR